jgi:hypothetical protein
MVKGTENITQSNYEEYDENSNNSSKKWTCNR